MHNNSRTTVKLEGVRSEWFDVNVGSMVKWSEHCDCD